MLRLSKIAQFAHAVFPQRPKTQSLRQNRREFLSLVGGAAASACFPAGHARALPDCIPPPKRYVPNPQIAISLKRMSEALAACNDGGLKPVNPHCRELRRLGGMTRLDGFVIDPERRDVVLWGIAEKDAPPLDIEDFLVACRAAHGIYVRREGGRTWISRPAISLDPNPTYYDEIHSSRIDYGTPEGRRRFETLARAPLTVRVDGMPRHTRVASVLVEADYQMKLVAMGDRRLPIPAAFPGTREAENAVSLAALRADRPDPVQSHYMRYWFAAGSFEYQYSQDIAFLETAPVVLLDEANLNTAVMTPSGLVSGFARAFTCEWSRRMEEINSAEPLWRDMHNMFRHFAISQIIASTKTFEKSGFDATFLLEGYSLEFVKLLDTMPAASKITVLKVDEKVLYRGNYGGVSLNLNDNLMMAKQRTSDVSAARTAVIGSRSSAAVAWNVR
jgi:hypothetical protein